MPRYRIAYLPDPDLPGDWIVVDSNGSICGRRDDRDQAEKLARDLAWSA